MTDAATMTEPTEESVRADVRAWLEANWNPDLGLVEWRTKLIDAGWAAPTWPKAWHGRDLPPALAVVVDQEIRRIGAVGVARAGVRNLAAADPARPRHGRAERGVPAPKPDRRVQLVPAVQRAGLAAPISPAP